MQCHLLAFVKNQMENVFCSVVVQQKDIHSYYHSSWWSIKLTGRPALVGNTSLHHFEKWVMASGEACCRAVAAVVKVKPGAWELSPLFFKQEILEMAKFCMDLFIHETLLLIRCLQDLSNLLRVYGGEFRRSRTVFLGFLCKDSDLYLVVLAHTCGPVL